MYATPYGSFDNELGTPAGEKVIQRGTGRGDALISKS